MRVVNAHMFLEICYSRVPKKPYYFNNKWHRNKFYYSSSNSMIISVVDSGGDSVLLHPNINED